MAVVEVRSLSCPLELLLTGSQLQRCFPLTGAAPVWVTVELHTWWSAVRQRPLLQRKGSFARGRQVGFSEQLNGWAMTPH